MQTLRSKCKIHIHRILDLYSYLCALGIILQLPSDEETKYPGELMKLTPRNRVYEPPPFTNSQRDLFFLSLISLFLPNKED